MGRLPAAVKRPLARVLLRNPWFVRKMVVERWFLHRNLPALPAA
jgi:hypothetical protein